MTFQEFRHGAVHEAHFFSQKSNGKIQAMSVPGCPNISAMRLAVSHYKLILFSIAIDLILSNLDI